MGKIKIHELAKELKMENKELIDIANKLGLKVTSHLNAIEEKDANRIRESVKSEDKKTEVKTTGQVIIRREVIVADEDAEKEKKKIEEAKRKTAGLGFNQKRNKDYNIVYREKPTKPMTVSELFGIKPKKEEKKVEPKKQEKAVKEEIKQEIPEVKTKQKVTVKEEHKEVPEKEQISNVKQNPVTKVNQEQKANFNKNNIKNNNFDNNARNMKTGYNSHNGGYNNRGNNGSRNNYNHQNNGEHGFNRNNRNGNSFSNNNFKNNNGNNNFKRPMNNKNIDRNIKDIMSTEIPEKSNQRDYSTRIIDKQKANRYNNQDDKKRRNRRGDEEDNFNEDKLRNLKQVDRLSNMFEDQEGGMLDYYDLTTVRGKRNKRKPKKDEERNTQKIFDL